MSQSTELHIVNIHELCTILKTNPRMVQHIWRKLPHFFIGRGRNLKGARVEVNKVVEYLENEVLV